MIIIGEKINGSIPAVAKAIAERDAAFIKARAIAQEEAQGRCRKARSSCSSQLCSRRH